MSGLVPAYAGQFSYLAIAQRYLRSKAVVLARVLAHEPAQLHSETGLIQTPILLKITHHWKGSLPDTIRLYLWGGEYNGIGCLHSAEVFPKPGTTLIAFLKQVNNQWQPAFFGYSYIFIRGGQAFDLLNPYPDVQAVIDSLNQLGKHLQNYPNNFAEPLSGSSMAPVITGVSPSGVCAGCGDTLTITGNNFGNGPNVGTGTYVAFPNPNNGGATYDPVDNSLYYVSWSSTQIQVIVPFNLVSPADLAGTGSVQVCVNNVCATAPTPTTISYSVYEPILAGARRTIHYADIGNTGGYMFTPSDSFKNIFTGAWQTLKRAMTTWRCNTFVHIDTATGTTTTNTHQNDNLNIVAYTAIDGPGGTLAFAIFWYAYCLNSGIRDYYISEVDLVVDNAENWYVGTGNPGSTQYDLESAILHELGHGLGLGHVIDPTDLMHWTLSAGQTKRTLNASNINAVTEKMNLSIPGTHCHGTMTPLTPANCSYLCNVSALITKGDVSCSGGSDGWIRLSVAGTTPFTHHWTPTPPNQQTAPDGSTDSIWGLTAGTWKDSIVDGQNCVAVITISIQEPPPLSVTIDSIRHIACKGDSTGLIIVTAYGGTPGYTYQWSNGQTGNQITNLPAGTYTVTVTDANGCQHQQTYTLSEPSTPLTISIDSVVHPACANEASGRIVVSASGGGPPYQITWNTGDTGSVLTDVPADTYIVQVQDSFGCIRADTVVLQAPPLLVTPSVVITLPSACGAGDGSLLLQVGGGAPPYSVVWSHGDTGTAINGLSAGVYIATVTDANGCTHDTAIVLPDPNAPSILLDSIVSPSCYGYSDGAITVSVTGGNPPYSFQWSTGATTEDLSGIPAGTYTLAVSDASGCQNFLWVEVTDPLPLTVTVVVDTISGLAWVEVSGGTPPYSYLWEGNLTDDTVLITGPGTYTVTVTDANGCTTTHTFTVGSVPTGMTANQPDRTPCQLRQWSVQRWTLTCHTPLVLSVYTLDGRQHYRWQPGMAPNLQIPPGMLLLVVHTPEASFQQLVHALIPVTLTIQTQ